MLLLQLPPFMENAAECVKTAMGDRHLSDGSSLSPGEPFRVESSAGELQGRSPWSSRFNKRLMVPSC